MDLAREDENALLVFSGYEVCIPEFLPLSSRRYRASGQTRRTSTTTEAESYMRLALAAGVLPVHSPSAREPSPALRATTENYALDSYQNLLFSIARFHEYTGRYPEQITVVGYEMKRRRFIDLHRAALRWPKTRFHYIGIDAEGDEGAKAREGEVGPYLIRVAYDIEFLAHAELEWVFALFG